MDNIEYVYTVAMDEAEVAAILEREENGVLALANDDVAYAIPVSFAFDGTSLYFRLGDDGTSRKMEFAASTTEANFVLYGFTDDTDSWSVVATGPLRRFPDPEDVGFDDAELNAAFPDLRVFDEDVEELDVVLFELQITSLVGRRTAA